ncbi:DUF397 domain-containing protein [Streptomyces mirabilis]
MFRQQAGEAGHPPGGGELVLETVGRQAATVHVRDSKDTRRAQLAFTGVSWTEFVSSVRR